MKKILKGLKSLWIGKRLRDVYAHATRWQRVKYFFVWKVLRHTLRYTVLTALLVSLIGAGFLYGKFGHTEEVFADSIRTVDSFDRRVDGLKDEVVNKIAQCESKNVSPEKALVTYDNNSRGTLTGRHVPSYGIMQYKEETVQRHYRLTHDGKTLTSKEAVLLALDNDKAKKLAKEAIFGIQGSVREWTCATPEIITEVTLIKRLMK